MGVVTNLILSFSTDEQVEARMKDVNSFPHDGSYLDFVPLDRNSDTEEEILRYGISRHFESNLFIGVYSHFRTEDFIAHLNRINWEDPERVRLFVKEDGDEKFRIIEIEIG